MGIASALLFGLMAATSCRAASVRQVLRPERLRAGNLNVRTVQPIDTAAWIWAEDDKASFVRLRTTFDCASETNLTLDVSADERFVLLLDGRPVSRGPHRGLVSHWAYQSYEIRRLAKGPHALEAVCWRLGDAAPLAQLSWRGGFVLKASDDRLTTGRGDWRAGVVKGTRPATKGNAGTFGVGTEFAVSGTSFLDEEPSVWTPAKVVRGPVADSAWGLRTAGWMLYPTERPDQLNERKTPGRVVNDPVDLTRPFTVPARTVRDLWWDLGDYYCAYPELRVAGGRGATVAWGWAESLRDAEGRKGDRAAWKGKSFDRAFTDSFTADGRAEARFDVPWWRCGRWCRLRIETRDEPLEVRSVAIAETRYPLSVDAAFACDDASFGEIWGICRRGMEACAHEMLFDCPYYEQQMYPGDTRVQLLILDALTRDDRLGRFAMSVFDYDRRADGLVAMNFPTRGTQESATYALCWTMMFRDYLLYHRNSDWLRARLPGVRHTLDALACCEDGASGLLADLPGWRFVDHALERGEAQENLFYLLALEAQEEVERTVGDPHHAALYAEKATRLKAAIVARYWDETRGLMADDAGKRRFSEHAQCLAVLADALDAPRRARALQGLVGDPTLVRCTPYFAHYLFEAFFRCGRADLVRARLACWRNFIRSGAKTPFETESLDSRSDCHAWSASPVYHFIANFAGIRPAAPGFRRVRIAPQPGGLKRIAAVAPHPDGLIRVDLSFAADGSASGSVVTPPGVEGTFACGGREIPLDFRTGQTHIK